MNEEIESFVEEPQREKITIDEFWKSTEKKRYLNAKTLANDSISEVEIVSVGEPYKKNFDGKERFYIDLEVKANDGLGKGEIYTFSVGVMNAITLKEKISENIQEWIGKRLKLDKERKGDIWYIVIKEVL